MKRAATGLLLTVLCAVTGAVLWPRHASGAGQLLSGREIRLLEETGFLNPLPDLRWQSAATPFLYPPYYGSEQVNCVFDHEYPIYFGEQTFGEPISSTVVHNDGIRRPQGGIGTPGCYSGHDGIDYGLVYERVLAAADGTIGDARWALPQNHRAELGMFVRINHPNSYRTFYGHLSVIAVQQGAVIKRGQVLGVSGTSGDSTGPHLHFTLRGSTNDANPYGWIGSPEIPDDPWLSLPEGGQESTNLWAHLPSTTNDIYSSGPALTPPPPPQPGQPNVVLIEDSAPIIGDSCQQAASGGYGGGSFRYATVISDSLSAGPPPTCALRWNIPGGAAGIYDVYAYIPATNANTESAVYQILHQGNTSQAIVHQAHFPDNQWAYLGQYAFNRDGSEYVTSSNVTLDVTNTLSIAFDAILLAPGAGIEPTPTATPGPSPTPTRTPTATPGPSPTAPTALPPATLITLAMTETVTGSPITLHDSSPPAQNARAYNTTYFARGGDYARNLPQAGGVYSAIRFDQDNSLYLADHYNRSMTIDILVRYAGTSGELATIANLYAKNSAGVRGGWLLQYDPQNREFRFTVRSGSASGTTATIVRQAATISATDWVHLKAIKDGSANKLVLCVAVNGGNWLRAEQAHNQGIYYIPNSTLDLGIASQNPDWSYNFRQN